MKPSFMIYATSIANLMPKDIYCTISRYIRTAYNCIYLVPSYMLQNQIAHALATPTKTFFGVYLTWYTPATGSCLL